MDIPMRLIAFDEFKNLEEIPRSDFQVEFITLDSLQNAREQSFVIFISHRWHQTNLPDSQDKSKFKQIISAVTKIKMQLEEGTKVYLWLDYFGIDQTDKAQLLLAVKSLPSYIYFSDCVYSPFDEIFALQQYGSRQGATMPFSRAFGEMNYQCFADVEDQYLGRMFCRLELFLCSFLPLKDGCYNFFKRIGSNRTRRPHFFSIRLEGCEDGTEPVRILPPLGTSFFKNVDPLKGSLPTTVDEIEKERQQCEVSEIRAMVQKFQCPNFPAGYEGECDENSQRGGYGIWVDVNGDRYEGQWSKDKFHGFGTYYYANGCEYEGNFIDGMKEGNGILRHAAGDRYEGNFSADVAEGQGTYYFANGNRCEGFFKSEKLEGPGTYYYADGDWYVGNFVCGAAEGYGTHYYTTGDRYEGNFVNDMAEGLGKYFYANGNHYEGSFLNDVAEGKGVYYFANGDRYEGDFVNDVSEGHGIHYYANGNRYEGSFVNDVAAGTGILYYSNGDRYEGNFVNDMAEGKGIFFVENGDRFEGNFAADKPEGPGIYYYASGERFEGEWIRGERHGTGMHYRTDGNKEELNFVLGQKVYPPKVPEMESV